MERARVNGVDMAYERSGAGPRLLFAERVPDATLHVYQGGHMFLLQDPAAFTDLLSFLART